MQEDHICSGDPDNIFYCDDAAHAYPIIQVTMSDPYREVGMDHPELLPPAIHDSIELNTENSACPLEMEYVEFPLQMWIGYFKECGLDEMLMSFRWDQPPMAGARHGETVFAFFLSTPDDGVPIDRQVGWGSLKRSADNAHIMEVIRGVRPKYRRQGYAEVMLKLLSDVAFRTLGAEQLVRNIYDTNTEHVRRNLEAADKGSPWVYAGRVWYPDPYRIFTYMKDSWAAGDVR